MALCELVAVWLAFLLGHLGLRSAPDGNGWTQHPGVNCYSGNGATDLEQFPGQPYGTMSLQDCEAACTAQPGCEGVVVSKPVWCTGGKVRCYRRGNIQLDQCLTDTRAFDLWTRTLHSCFLISAPVGKERAARRRRRAAAVALRLAHVRASPRWGLVLRCHGLVSLWRHRRAPRPKRSQPRPHGLERAQRAWPVQPGRRKLERGWRVRGPCTKVQAGGQVCRLAGTCRAQGFFGIDYLAYHHYVTCNDDTTGNSLYGEMSSVIESFIGLMAKYNGLGFSIKGLWITEIACAPVGGWSNLPYHWAADKPALLMEKFVDIQRNYPELKTWSWFGYGGFGNLWDPNTGSLTDLGNMYFTNCHP